jgi:large subunit ribosomal protein L3
MCLGLLGNKIGMTQIFYKNIELIPVTIIKCGPCYITQITNNVSLGYKIIKIGYILNLKKSNKKTHLKYKFFKEYTVISDHEYIIGQELSVNLFKIGELINITGLTIGKGNSGNIKKNNFTRGPMSHGSKHHRLQGSLGAGTSPGRVFPGKKMPGRLGATKCTIKNLEIIDIDLENDLIVIKGSIPGKAGNFINITY